MTALDHIGLSVADLHGQARWYERALGLRALPPLGSTAAGIRTQYLVDPDEGWAIELVERTGSQPGLQATSPAEAIMTRGYGHICLRVKELDALYEHLLEAGARAISPPGASPMSGLPIAFVADPEGNLLELIARPSPLQREARPPSAGDDAAML
ncbi:VOC family protein [Microbacterium oryzae]|uniref:VOC family protein n=1 Tax=Microbacterium oryzae TaxID=743009 RepID=UPI0025B03684|nr:VOC family protein [Microbacterium oryzae]MDN3310195.1 VOC family protein [Microbacterium oryzae]